MPLGDFEREVLRLLAANRNPDSYVAGATVVIERGCFYLDSSGKPVCPNPASADFPGLTRHYGSLKGAWPRIVES